MREIKFRIWDGVVMYEPFNLIELFGVGSNYVQVVERNDLGDKVLSNGYEIMQYTGLKDKNGKEIYEGDIVEWKYLQTWHKNEVRWVGGGFVVTTSGFKDDLNEPQDLSLVSILNCEIIGNVWENPELIKK